MNMKAENFGKNLKDILDYLGMTQFDLAQRTGLTPASISQIISGLRDPNLITIVKILNAIPVSFERLVK